MATDFTNWNVFGEEGVADYIAASFWSPERRIEQWRSHLGWLPGGIGETVLDVACGNGNMRRVYTDLKGMVYQGCDVAPRMVELARVAHPDCQFRQAAAEDLPYPDGSFDHVVCLALLMHLPLDHEEPIIAELRRVARRTALVHQRCALGTERYAKQRGRNIICRAEPLVETLERMRAIEPAVQVCVGDVTGSPRQGFFASFYFVFHLSNEDARKEPHR